MITILDVTLFVNKICSALGELYFCNLDLCRTFFKLKGGVETLNMGLDPCVPFISTIVCVAIFA